MKTSNDTVLIIFFLIICAVIAPIFIPLKLLEITINKLFPL